MAKQMQIMEQLKDPESFVLLVSSDVISMPSDK